MLTTDKIHGIILGHALGDTLGAPSEFPPKIEYTGELVPNVLTSQFQGTRTFVAGQVTDDTEMAIALMYSLGTGTNAQIEYMEWANSGNPCLGKNTKNLFKGVTTVGGYLSRYQKHVYEVKPEDWSQSNGCLMRAYPLAFSTVKFNPEQCNNLVKNDVCLTNPAPICIEAVQQYVWSIRIALFQDKFEVVSMLKKNITHPDLKIALEQAQNPDPSVRDITVNRGWIAHAFYCAFWALFNFDDYRTAIDAVIVHSRRGKTVGDTDTNACIAGALLGAYYGYEEMCKNKRTKKEIDVMLSADPSLGDVPRPEKYLMNRSNLDKFTSWFT